MKNFIILIVKLIILVLIIYQLYNKVNISEILGYFRKLNWLHLLFAFLCFNVSYNLSAIRLKNYLRNGGINSSYKSSLNIGYRSSLVSNFLPGGVGGEGYKIYILNKIYMMNLVDAFKIVLSDRGSGMLALAILSFVLLPFASLKIEIVENYKWLLALLGLLINLGLYRYITKKYLNETLKLSAHALFYSLIVQLLCATAYYAILSDINPNIGIIEYSIAFFLSSVALVFPVSLGGIGIREISLVYSSYMLNIDTEIAITGAIIFYLISLVSSMFLGSYFFTRKIS